MSDVNKKGSFISKYKFDIFFILLIATAAFLLSISYSVLYIHGESMSPTYNDSDTLILKNEKKTTNGNIVVFNSPDSWSKDDKKFIKRIIASEGDTLEISNDKLIVNGVIAAETSEKKCGLSEDKVITIDDGKYFVVGDNYSSSNDSLTQFCNGNGDFLVDEKEIVLNGKQLIIIGGFFN